MLAVTITCNTRMETGGKSDSRILRIVRFVGTAVRRFPLMRCTFRVDRSCIRVVTLSEYWTCMPPIHVCQTWNAALLQVCRRRVKDHKQKLNIGHPCCGQLTPVKTRYPLTSIRWPYRGLKWSAHRGQLFFRSWPVPSYWFPIGSQAQARLKRSSPFRLA